MSNVYYEVVPWKPVYAVRVVYKELLWVEYFFREILELPVEFHWGTEDGRLELEHPNPSSVHWFRVPVGDGDYITNDTTSPFSLFETLTGKAFRKKYRKTSTHFVPAVDIEVEE